MKVSLNWVRHINDKYKCAADPAPKGVDDLVDKIGAQLGAVDEVIDLGKKYEGALVVKVVDCIKHPNADKLSVCLVDDGKKTKGIDRNKEGLIQVVCGAPNVKAGQLVVWLPPGVTVPSSFDKDPFILEAREIRGQISNGMIASARELALGDDHTGILVLDDNAAPGESFASAYGLNDHIIDIENKMFTHRPDLFGMLGIAREIAGIQQNSFKSPSWYVQDADLHNDGRKNVLKLSVKNELPKLVPRFVAVAIKDVKVEESPVWLRIRLSSVGVRPINNIVDLTNFMMMETGQPLHAYDYDKVKSGVLGVRMANDGEKVTVIGGKEIKLKTGAIVITDGEKAIGLGGVMGGASTQVDENTKNIILEVANFDMNTTRRTAMEYGLFTDAATRFTKNQSSRQQRAVLCKAVDDIKKIAGGRVASLIVDIDHAKKAPRPVIVSTDFINERLGLELAPTEIKKILTNVEFIVESPSKTLSVTAPFWRTDIEIAEDIVEEVGRLYGYDHLNMALPSRSIKAAPRDKQLVFNSYIRDLLAEAGANEVLTYNFVHESLFKAAGQDKKLAYHLRNALSPDLQYYRLSVLPSLVEKVHPNIKLGYGSFVLFEIGKSHNKAIKDENEADLPKEIRSLAVVAWE
jgi:phenylalanyl-tRNA synthetase beta chain